MPEANVVNLASRRRNEPEPLQTVVDDLRGLIPDVRAVGQYARWLEQQLERERARNRGLSEALLERAGAFAFTDDAVLAALRRAWDGSPVSATEVVRALGVEPTQSRRIRAGHALSRLAKAGKVKVAARPDRRVTTRWAPA